MKHNSKKKTTTRNILIAVLVVVLLAGACFGIIAIVSKVNSTPLKTLHPTFVRGSLDEQGQDVETRQSIVTQKYFECRGLEITRDNKSTVSYEVFFYNVELNFISSTGALDKNYDGVDMPSNAIYARIVVTPSTASDLSFVDVWTYAAQITIKVSRNQNIELLATFDFGKKDPTRVESSDGTLIGDDSIQFTDGDFTLTLVNLHKVFSNSYDTAGNSCLKLGSGSEAGWFDISTPDTDEFDSVVYVVIYVTGYKSNSAKISITGVDEPIEIETLSSEGEYTAIKIPVSRNDTYHFSTVEGGLRCKIDKIEFWGFASETANEAEAE